MKYALLNNERIEPQKGIKKKLFVYQGDKAEQLATEFAMENSKNIYFVNYFVLPL